MKYVVTRQHYGDRLYSAGQEREARPSEVAHLVASGVLVEKAAEPVKTKARPVSKNKAK